MAAAGLTHTDATGPGPMAKAALAAVVRVPDEATSVNPLPALLIARPLKLTTPLTAFIVVVPDSVPPAGFVPRATVTTFVELGTVLPKAS
jgi:hypothetical protein